MFKYFNIIKHLGSGTYGESFLTTRKGSEDVSFLSYY